MDNQENGSLLFRIMSRKLDKMSQNLESVTERDRNTLEGLRSLIERLLGISEHTTWRVDWEVFKYKAKNLAEVIASGETPYEICRETQNIILDTGANEMLKLIGGITATAFSNANAKMFVGTDSSSEAASQTGVIATGTNRAYASMDSSYPQVSGRTIMFRASFDENTANFNWNEAAIANGNGASAVSMNRKVTNLGTKTTGTWTLQLTISIVAA